jgi:hypothetical protein
MKTLSQLLSAVVAIEVVQACEIGLINIGELECES